MRGEEAVMVVKEEEDGKGEEEEEEGKDEEEGEGINAPGTPVEASAYTTTMMGRTLLSARTTQKRLQLSRKRCRRPHQTTPTTVTTTTSTTD